MPDQTLEGKVAIISGSVSGIGLAVAKELSDRVARVVINYPYPEMKYVGERIAERLPHRCITVEADMSNTTGPSYLVEATIACFGRLDILINNAGLANNLPFEEHTLEHWESLVTLNDRGTRLWEFAADD